LRARYYEPSIGRFISRDPIGYEDGLNIYTYVGNNPINRLDPFGLDACMEKCVKDYEWDKTVCDAWFVITLNPVAWLKCLIEAYRDNLLCVANCCEQ